MATVLLLTRSELRAGDRITGVILHDQTIVDKHDWVVKAAWGPHPYSGSDCIQMQPLPNRSNFEFNLWSHDLAGLTFWVSRPD